MADAGVARDPGRLPWLEPYRAPPRSKSNRSAGAATAIGMAGLAVVLTLLMRDAPMLPGASPEAPQASVVLPAPADMGPAVVLPPLAKAEASPPTAVQSAARARPVKARVQRRIKAVPTSVAYRKVVKEQAGEPVELDTATAEVVMAIAAMPAPPADPPRPAVNPSARVVRGKTVQLGVYTSSRQAEAAWRSAIRDYTYLVTMPKSIQAISIRSKRFYRLQLGTPSKQHARQLCTNLKSIGRTCTVA